jgi:hypothetical protein
VNNPERLAACKELRVRTAHRGYGSRVNETTRIYGVGWFVNNGLKELSKEAGVLFDVLFGSMSGRPEESHDLCQDSLFLGRNLKGLSHSSSPLPPFPQPEAGATHLSPRPRCSTHSTNVASTHVTVEIQRTLRHSLI